MKTTGLRVRPVYHWTAHRSTRLTPAATALLKKLQVAPPKRLLAVER